jgi:sugar lactone lactonase YvrE
MNSRRRLLTLSLSLGLALPTAGVCAGAEAVRELGQPDFYRLTPNRVDARGLAAPWGVAVDTSRSPHGLWVVDAGNSRVLGWRDAAGLRDGAPADVVLGQPDALSNRCNTGGVSAASLCLPGSTGQSFNNQPGLAVDAEGNLYVADQANYRILGYRRPFDTDRVADVVLGQARFDQVENPVGQEPNAGRIFGPRGLATDAQGNLYASDLNRVLEFDRPFATDALADRIFGQSSLDAFDPFTDPGAPDRIATPDGVAVDGEGRLYVADAWMDRVMVWKQPLVRQGAADLVFAQGNATCDSNGCFNAKGIAVEPDGDLWVGSFEQGRIYGYRSPARDGDTTPDRILVAASSRHLRQPDAPPDGPMSAHGGLAVDSTGTLWLADQNRVLGFFDPWNGNGRADRLLGQVRRDQLEPNLVDFDGLKAPDGIALDTSANPPHLYVVDSLNQRVLGWADAEGFTNGQPADLVLGQPDRWSTGCNPGGPSLCLAYLSSGSLNDIAVDPQGTVWVSDQGNARVLGYRSPFTTDTVADLVLGGIGCVTGPRGLCLPGGLAVDKAGNLYVADIGNNRILEFNAPSRFDTLPDRVLGARNLRQPGCNDRATCFSEPEGTHPGLYIYGGPLAVDANGRLLVGNRRAVYVFDRPLRPGARSRKLIDLDAIEGNFYDTPYGLATDSAARIYVTAGFNVYRFSRTGAGPTLQLGERCYDSAGRPLELGRASLCNPTGLAVGLRDELFVSDAGANRVVVFENF